MRSVPFTEQGWFFSGKENLQGIRSGNDFCTEHEMGIKSLQEVFGLDLSIDGLERNRITALPETLSFFKNDRFIGIIYSSFYFESPEKVAESYERCSFNNEPLIAWDDESFLIMSPVGQKKYVKAIKALWEAFQKNDILMGGSFSDKYSGSGLGFFIASKMPKEEIDNANNALILKAKEKKDLETASKKEGFTEVVKKLRESGKRWFFLKPSMIGKDGKVLYWLNPIDQENNGYGSFTIEDLKLWSHNKGRIVN